MRTKEKLAPKWPREPNLEGLNQWCLTLAAIAKWSLPAEPPGTQEPTLSNPLYILHQWYGMLQSHTGTATKHVPSEPL